MLYDAQGLFITAESDDGIALAYQSAVDGYLQYRTDTAARVARLVDRAPDFAMAHVLKGYLALLPLNEGLRSGAQEALHAAQRHSARATSRERAHVLALRHWLEGNIELALHTWETILSAQPRDLLAFRMHHNLAFWHGLPKRMLQQSHAVAPHWQAAIPGKSTVLACHAFASEECGLYSDAERSGREALEIEPGNPWATHAVTHVMEMQGRRTEGIRFLNNLEPLWERVNHFKHHLRWHRAMFHLELEEVDIVLDLYDRRFRNLASPLLASMSDLFNDILNATSMLFRLELHGVPVEKRWEELADKAELRIGDTLSRLTVTHWMMALTGAGRWQVAARLLEAVKEKASSVGGDPEGILANVVVPICDAVRLHRLGRYAEIIVLMRPALSKIQRLGGSHAQRDVFHQLYLDAALKSANTAEVLDRLTHAAQSHPVPPERRIGYRRALQKTRPATRCVVSPFNS